MTDQPLWVDSHCHLNFPEFANDIDAVVDRAQNRGVNAMLTICTSLAEYESVAGIAEQFTAVFFAAGTHPHKAASEPMATVEELTLRAHHPKMVGIGESGLDYHYSSNIVGAQKRSLMIHIEAARCTGLPLIIHSRDACDDMSEILASEHSKGAFDCVMHCFSSSRKLAQAALSLGFYLSMSGITTFRNAEILRQIFSEAPIDRILVETDAPYLAPVPNRGRRNEPSFVVDTGEAAARLFGLSTTEFATRTTENFFRLFSKAADWIQS